MSTIVRLKRLPGETAAGGAKRHLVARADNERVEGVVRDQLADARCARALHLFRLAQSFGVLRVHRAPIGRDDETNLAGVTELAFDDLTNGSEEITFDPGLVEDARYLQHQLFFLRKHLDRFDPCKVIPLS